jgi:hypothetical protein
MTSIVPGSANITLEQRPAIRNPEIRIGDVTFDSTGIALRGSVALQGSAHDSPAGWTAGFIQLQFVETNWAYYRGLTNHDGSVLIQVAAHRYDLGRPAGIR